MKRLYEINYYDSDHGGMHTLHTKREIFFGTHKEAVEKIENTKSPWGLMYMHHTVKRHAVGVITKTSQEILDLEEEIFLKEQRLEELRKKVK